MASDMVLGLVTGLTYGLLAVGIVLIFKANRFINLAHAQLGALSALLLGRFVLDDGWTWWLAFPVVTAVGIATGVVIERVVVRPMLQRRRHAVSLLLVTVGVAQLLLALTYVQDLGPSTRALNLEGYPVPFDASVEVGDLVLRGQHLMIIGLVPAVVLALAAFLRWSFWGKSIRAAASNPDAARLCGVPVDRVSAIAWGIAGGISAVTAVLQAPSQGTFNAAALGPGLLLRTLGAAAFGGFTSIPKALVGGLVIAQAEHLALGVEGDTGVAELVVLATVIVIVFVRGRSINRAWADTGALPDDPARLRVPDAARSRAIARRAPAWGSALALFVALVAPLLPFLDSESRRFQLVVTVVMAIAGIALTMVLGWAGQVSLGHYALLGLGGYLAAELVPHGLSLPVVLLLAGIAGAGVMALVGVPALRVRGLTLAVTTLGFAVVAPIWLFQQPWLGAAGQATVAVERPGLRWVGHVESQLGVYYTAVALLVLVVIAASRLRRTMPGRLMIAVRDNERAAAAFGTAPATVKLSVLAVSGAFVAMAGVLWAASWQTVSIDLVRPESSLVLLAIPVIGGIGSVGGAVAGAVAVYLPTFLISPLLEPVFGSFGRQVGFQLALAGLGLVVIPLTYPAGIAGAARRGWERLLERVAASVATGDDARGDDVALRVRDVRKRFGGLEVLRGLDLEVRRGEIVGLIGPNGAGKTTLMDVIAGELAPDGGVVEIDGRDVTALPPDLRAHLGIGRNHQDASLFGGLTVREALQVAVASRRKVGVVAAMLSVPWARHAERRTRADAEDVIARFGLAPWADARVADLSTGTRRICQLAAQVAFAPRVLLLDEPTAGVAQREAERFGPLLRRVRDELRCSVLVIEHDMPLLMGVCDRIYAMQGGEIIAVGTPEEIRHDAGVVASYLGTAEVAIARSGATA